MGSLRKVDQLYHRTYASNPRARHDNHILEKYETGLVLTGQEVKAIKNGRVSIKGAYLKFIKKEAFAISLKVTEDSFQFPIKDKDRMKKVLMHKRELRDLDNFSKDRGATLVVLSIYDKDGVIKLQVAKARGKK